MHIGVDAFAERAATKGPDDSARAERFVLFVPPSVAGRAGVPFGKLVGSPNDADGCTRGHGLVDLTYIFLGDVKCCTRNKITTIIRFYLVYKQLPDAFVTVRRS